MNYRVLGNTGLSVSEIGLGTLAVGGPFTLAGQDFGRGPVDDRNSRKMIQVALDAGVTLIDTADIYGFGHAERILSEALVGKRQKVVLSTKAGNRGNSREWYKDFSPAWIEKSCDKSLERLFTDYLDLYLLHTPVEPFAFDDALSGVFESLQKAGKIRFYGLSAATPAQALRAIESGFGQVVEIAYHLCDRSAEESLLTLAREKGIGVIVKAPLCSGLLTGKYNKNSFFAANDFRAVLYPREEFLKIVDVVDALRPVAGEEGLTLAQLALKFCLARPEISAAVPGAKTPGQILENVRASDGRGLSARAAGKLAREGVLP
jgi:aryl-alcohol dehydrogenase-like predicted oxidoreductase